MPAHIRVFTVYLVRFFRVCLAETTDFCQACVLYPKLIIKKCDLFTIENMNSVRICKNGLYKYFVFLMRVNLQYFVQLVLKIVMDHSPI